MFGIGFLEICVIAVVALVFVGPKRLPELMRQAGKFFVQFRRVSSEVKSNFDQVVYEAEVEAHREKLKESTQKTATITKDVPPKAISTDSREIREEI